MADFPQGMGVLPPSEIAALPPYYEGIPILYEDDDEDAEMGESNLHTLLDHIIFAGLESHCEHLPGYQVFGNMNVYYPVLDHRDLKGRLPSVAPDVMLVRPDELLPVRVSSYRILHDGPAPEVIVEILSPRTAQDVDLTQKVELYRRLGVREYILVDDLGELLPQRLLLKRLRDDRTWDDCQDVDGGVTSTLGFRLVFEEDDQLRVVNTETRERYVRPAEARGELLKARRDAEVARQQAIADQLAVEKARRQAEKRAEIAEKERKQALADKLAEEEARKKAERDKLAEEEARKKAERDKLAEEEARKKAERDKLDEAKARKKAERDKLEAEKARKKAEDRLKELEEELKRLRGES